MFFNAHTRVPVLYSTVHYLLRYRHTVQPVVKSFQRWESPPQYLYSTCPCTVLASCNIISTVQILHGPISQFDSRIKKIQRICQNIRVLIVNIFRGVRVFIHLKWSENVWIVWNHWNKISRDQLKAKKICYWLWNIAYFRSYKLNFTSSL